MQSVLIVEPDEHIAKQIRMLAAQAGFEVIEWVEDEKEAIDKVSVSSEINFDLIISEWQLKEMNAIDFFKSINFAMPDKKIYFIVVSEKASTSQVRLAANAGVYAYVLKPIDSTIMIKRMSFLRNEVNYHARLL